MATGISDSDTAMNQSSHLKRPGTQVSARLKPPRKRKKLNTVRDSVEFDGDDAYNSRLSAKTRDTVLKLKKITDPFDEGLQEVVDDVFEHFETQACDNVDLAESALLLGGVTQVYCTQVMSLHEEVLAMAARLTGREKPKKGRGRRKVQNLDDIPLKEDKNTESERTGEDNPEQDASNEDAQQNENQSEETSGIENDNGETSQNIEPHEDGDASIADPANNNENEKNSTESNSAQNNVEASENSENSPEGANPSLPAAEELKKLESEILNEIPARCTRRQSERLKNILNIEAEAAKERDYKLKKRKYDDDPPDLISCFEEWDQVMQSIKEHGDVDFDEIMPPLLEVQVGRRAKKMMTINNNEINEDDDNNCETCHLASGMDTKSNDCDEAVEPSSLFLVPLPPSFDGQKYETLDHLPTDIQESFHSLVQEMHKLPFDYGMQKDMFKAYQQKFLQAVSLLSQNSVLVKRPEKAKNEDIPAKVTERLDSHTSESETLSSITELLNQVRQQAAEEYNKGKQSTLNADVPVSQMIATLKRIICSRYKKWHVRTDSDKAVFRRIKEFEDRVKAVLRKEAEQGLFDVKKYEMEVMDVTLKESQDNENDEFGCPTSPLQYLSEGPDSPNPEETRNWSLSSPSRRSSIAGSVDGSSSWIRMLDIFSHMKKIDNSETCRHFYAVLALLSHQNLSINYDTLFSQESAKLITKLLKKHQQGSIEKYPVGAKIMTARCPDVEQDEILLTPVLSAAFRQVLEQDGYLSSSGYQSDSQGSSNTSTSFSQPKSIQDAMSEFVLDPGEPLLTDDLFNTRKRKK